MKGDKIIANFNYCQKVGKNCICVNIETGEYYNLETVLREQTILGDQPTGDVHFLFKNSSDHVITATKDDVESKFMLASDWEEIAIKCKDSMFPALITNVTRDDVKKEIESGNKVEGPIVYFKFHQYVNDNTLIYELIYKDGDFSDTWIVKLDRVDLELAIEDPVAIARRMYEERQKYLRW